MTKFHTKTKQTQKLGYRTPDFFRGQTFGGNKKAITSHFNPSNFRTQHKG